MKCLFVLSLIFLISCSFAEDTKPTTLSTEASSKETTVSSTEPSTSSTALPTTSSSEATSSTSAPTTRETTTTTTPVPTPEPPKTSTVAPVTESTSQPTESTSQPTESTSPPTTVSSSTSSSPTEAPLTTTDVPVTTKTPIPVPEDGFWNVTSGNTTCIRATLKILFKISLKGQDDYIALMPNISSDGSSCHLDNDTQELVLTDADYNLIFVFEKKSGEVYVKNITFTYKIPTSTDTVRNTTEMFKVKQGNSYMCTATSDVMLGETVTMQIMNIRLQAFGEAGNKDFGTAEECEEDNKVNDIVPIAVGVALLALVVVVLIAYLVGRRRSRQKGYQSV